jgi:transcriptional regulator
MYIPAAFAEQRREVLHDLIRQHSFGTLVSHTPSGLFATHLPLLLDTERGEYGVLRAHMARANPHWRSFAGASAGGDTNGRTTDGIEPAEALVLFEGPHTYISPSWYETERAVPTWNYVVVHAYGYPRLIDDPAELRALLNATVDEYEREFERPWSTARLPEDYVASMMEGIVGFELPISRLEGKLKLSQNRPPADRKRVIAALRRQDTPASVAVASHMDALERERGDEARPA